MQVLLVFLPEGPSLLEKVHHLVHINESCGGMFGCQSLPLYMPSFPAISFLPVFRLELGVVCKSCCDIYWIYTKQKK